MVFLYTTSTNNNNNNNYYYYYYYYYYHIDGRIYLNLSKSNQSAARLDALKPAANGCYVMYKSVLYYIHLLYIYAYVSKVPAESVRISAIHRTLT